MRSEANIIEPRTNCLTLILHRKNFNQVDESYIANLTYIA